MLRACTLLSRSPSALRARVSQLPPAFRENPLLFALSSNVEGAALSDLVSTLTTDHGHARLGALSGALSPGTISCSVAMLDKAVSSSFRSSLPGRDPDSVGRWHPIREETKEGAYERQGSSAYVVVYMSRHSLELNLTVKVGRQMSPIFSTSQISSHKGSTLFSASDTRRQRK
jgi:hypothetical protein